MKICVVLGLFALFLVACGADPTTESTVEPTTQATKPTTLASTTTLAPSTSESTTATSTTLEPTTTPKSTSTVEPTTQSTTVTPTTQSTVAPTTTTKTTPAPTTQVPTTQVPITTTKSPEPPVPEIGSWNVSDGNLTCIRADLKLRFKIPVNGRDEYIVLNPNATGSGECNAVNGTQELSITDSNYGLTLFFEKESSDVYLKSIEFFYSVPEHPATVTVINSTRLFGVKEGNAYLCNSLEDVRLENVTMEIFHIHVQAYGKVGDTNFGAAEECEADNKVDDIVPIAVGCALLALVAVVLIAYFVGRRRNRQKGYQSV